jgi:hypothetical protein
VAIDPSGNHKWVEREITEGALAMQNQLNPSIEDLPKRFVCLVVFLNRHSAAGSSEAHNCFCMVEFEEGEEIVALECGHLYHVECLGDRLEMKAVPEPVCPFCALKK